MGLKKYLNFIMCLLKLFFYEWVIWCCIFLFKNFFVFLIPGELNFFFPEYFYLLIQEAFAYSTQMTLLPEVLL